MYFVLLLKVFKTYLFNPTKKSIKYNVANFFVDKTTFSVDLTFMILL